MSRYLQALDPRRSLATAFAWFAVVLSLARLNTIRQIDTINRTMRNHMINMIVVSVGFVLSLQAVRPIARLWTDFGLVIP